MKVELLYFDGCPNYEALVPRLRGILRREGIESDIELLRVETPEQAARLGFLGSPTVRVDGNDVETAAGRRRDFGLKCRLYRTPNGLRGAPADDLILAAIRDRGRGDEEGATMADTDRIDVLAAQIGAATPELDASLQRAALTLLRLLAQAEPVGVQRLSEALALPAAYVDETLERSPGVLRDDRGRVVGFMGLSVAPISDHQLHLDGRSLWAWCAWDTLFLPELLGETARVSSRCPNTGKAISLTVTPNGPAGLAPLQTVVSFLVPETQFDANVLQSFCHYVHFFASPDAAASWTAEHPGTFPLSVDDAHRLGKLTNRATFGAALDAPRTA